MFYFGLGINPRILNNGEVLQHGVRILINLDVLLEGEIKIFTSIKFTI